ncbi:MAG: hypothetical protein ACXWUC_07405 [Methylosarcina sp.]
MPDIEILPFEYTADSIGEWLIILEKLPLGEKVKRLNKMITHLIQAPTEAERLFPVLNELTETLLLLSSILEHIATSENKENLSENTRKFTSFAVQLPKKLCFAYAQLADHGSTAETQRLLCIYRALQILSLLIKRNTLFYEAPDPVLWKKMAELYLLAESSGFLTVPVTDNVSGLLPQSTIEAVIKHALLFYICRSYCYSPPHIAEIFNVTADLTHVPTLDAVPSGFTMCYWNPYAQCPPQSVNPDRTPEEDALFINVHESVDDFEPYFNKPERRWLFEDLMKHLTAYQEIRQSVTPGKSEKGGLIIGARQAFKFLNILISRYRILELSGAIQEKNLSAPMELVPMEADRHAMASLSTKILKDDKSLSANNIGIYPTEDRAFCTTKTGLACTMDEPVILVYENQPPFFALIRYIQTETGVKLKTLLLEIIDGSVYPLQIGEKQCFVVLSPGSGMAELFLPPNYNYANNSLVFPEKGVFNKSIRIEKFIELTAHFSRYQISIY